MWIAEIYTSFTGEPGSTDTTRRGVDPLTHRSPTNNQGDRFYALLISYIFSSIISNCVSIKGLLDNLNLYSRLLNPCSYVENK